MTNIAISGACGKMGRVIADICASRSDVKVIAGIDLFGEKYSDFPVVKSFSELPARPDVIIDFSNPSALEPMLEYCKGQSVPVVIATTGYSAEQTAATARIRTLFILM